MISRTQYLEALQVVKNYVYQLEQYDKAKEKVDGNLPLEKGSTVKYIGGSTSKFLTKGKEYELATKEQKDSFVIFNDDKKRARFKKSYFEKVKVKTKVVPLPEGTCPICRTNEFSVLLSDGYTCANCRTKFQ